MRIVVMHEGCNRALEMLLVQNQEPIEAPRPDGTHKAFRHAVCLRRPIWGPHDLDAFRLEHRVEALGKLLIPIPESEIGSVPADRRASTSAAAPVA